MKNLVLGIIFSAIISLGSTVQAVTLKEKAKVGSFKDGDKKKKKKCDKKEDCAGKEKKSCCPSKAKKEAL